MFFGKPFYEKVKSALAAFRADFSTPARPVLDKPFITEQLDNFIIGSIFQKAARCPILIESSFCEATVQDFLELPLIKIVIP